MDPVVDLRRSKPDLVPQKNEGGFKQLEKFEPVPHEEWEKMSKSASESLNKGLGRFGRNRKIRRINEQIRQQAGDIGNNQTGREQNNAAEIEESNAEQLAEIRAREGVAREAEDLYKEGQSFNKPSAWKYLFIGLLALAKDIFDAVILLGVVTIPLAWLIGPFLSITIFLLFWFFNIKQKKAEEYIKNLSKRMEAIQGNIAEVIRIGKMIPGVKKRVGIQIGKATAKLTKFAARYPSIWIAAGGALDFISSLVLLGWLPWSTISVIVSYMSERKIYKNAAHNAEEAYEQLQASLAEQENYSRQEDNLAKAA